MPALMRALLMAFLLVPAPGLAAATYHVAASGSDEADGSAAHPWRTLQRGVGSLKPGDALLVGAGTYRESVEIRAGGTPHAPITVAAQPGARVVVTGADLLRDGWHRVEGADAVYWHDWPHRFPIGGPDDLTHPGDLEHMVTGRAEQVIHGGRLLRQVLRREQVAPGTFHVDLEAKRLTVWLRDSGDPGQTEVEASVRPTWLVGPAPVSNVRLRGLTFRYAANHAQRGALAIGIGGSGVSRGWVVEDCVIERANAAGASLSGEGHRFRRCVFQDNGQIGFGTSRCHDTVMAGCSFTRNNAKGYSTGWEAGALKVTMSRGFVLDGCRSVDNRGTGVWFDIGNEKAVVRHCTIADNDEAGIFYEISYGLHAHDNLIVNNANLGERPGGAWGSGGITLSSSEGCLVERNTLIGNRDGIALREQQRTTPRIDGPGGEVRVFNRHHVIRDNVVAWSQAYNVALWFDSRFFGPHPSGADRGQPLSEDPKTLDIRFANNLLWPLPGRPNYLYGAPWRAKSREMASPAEFTAASKIADSSRVADPLFRDPLAGDYAFRPGSPALRMGAGARTASQVSRSPQGSR